MKKCLLMVASTACMIASAVQISWLFCYDYEFSGNAIPFDTLVISAVQNANFSDVTGPWKHEDGTISTSPTPVDGDIYIGYSGDLIALKTLPYTADDPQATLGFATGVSDIDLRGFENSMFFMEVMSGDRVVGYSELSSYDDLRAAFMQDEWGEDKADYVTWTPVAHAIPEPSSGLLLLIGGALVGLRRKRRAA